MRLARFVAAVAVTVGMFAHCGTAEARYRPLLPRLAAKARPVARAVVRPVAFRLTRSADDTVPLLNRLHLQPTGAATACQDGTCSLPRAAK